MTQYFHLLLVDSHTSMFSDLCGSMECPQGTCAGMLLAHSAVGTFPGDSRISLCSIPCYVVCVSYSTMANTVVTLSLWNHTHVATRWTDGSNIALLVCNGLGQVKVGCFFRTLWGKGGHSCYRECHARSAKFWMSANTRYLLVVKH